MERLAAAWDADPEDDEALAAALVEAVGVARVSPDSDLPPVAELAGDLADVYERLGRVDEAVAAMREAIEAGWDGVPDGRCRVAEILTAAGRLDEATVIWRQVAGEFPDDVWVHNNAGIEYARAGEHEIAVGYLTRGLELALGSGDPERLVDQLNHFRPAPWPRLEKSRRAAGPRDRVPCHAVPSAVPTAVPWAAVGWTALS